MVTQWQRLYLLETLNGMARPEVLDISVMTEDIEAGYILDVDVDYPIHLQDNHSDLPFLAENKIINKHRKLYAIKKKEQIIKKLKGV